MSTPDPTLISPDHSREGSSREGRATRNRESTELRKARGLGILPKNLPKGSLKNSVWLCPQSGFLGISFQLCKPSRYGGEERSAGCVPSSHLHPLTMGYTRVRMSYQDERG